MKTLLWMVLLCMGALASGAEFPDTFQAADVKKHSRPVIEETVPGTLWVDAEDFADYGGWYHDTQFVFLMGSGYLMAQGVGSPVQDAVTPVILKNAGTYRLWIRTHNWDVEHSPGRFQVVIDGDPVQEEFGDSPVGEWTWEDGGLLKLTAGSHELRLRDLTGYYGRCDALILTADMGYLPPATLDKITAERARLTGLDLHPVVHKGFDVVVVGGGSTGSSAAIASARAGARTALIQDRPVLGGNTSAELCVGFQGAGSKHGYMFEGGLALEASLEKAHNHFNRWSAPWQKLAEAETNLTVFFNHRVDGVIMDNESRIKGVEAVQTLDGTRAVFIGTMFVDCTGDGWVGYYAGADFRLGREARNEFNEPDAPLLADNITMSGCLMGDSAYYRAVDTGKVQPFQTPLWASRINTDIEKGRQLTRASWGDWWIEYPGTVDDLWKMEDARDYLYKITYGYFGYLKNNWTKKEIAAPYVLQDISPLLAKREGRRLMGDFVLTENQALNPQPVGDAIGHYGWNLDVHHPRGIFSGADGPFYCDHRTPVGAIPYRCIYSRNIQNLLMGGRCISVTHLALGTVRVSRTCSVTGQAAGTAAAKCAEYGLTPRQMGQTRIHELQQILLRNDQYIPGVVNEDTADLARHAKCSASSEAQAWALSSAYFEKPGTIDSSTIRLDMPYVMCPAGRDGTVGTLNVYVLSRCKTDEQTVLTVYGADRFGDFDSLEPVGSYEVTVPAGYDGTVEIPVNARIKKPFMVLKFVNKGNPQWNLLWRRCSASPPQFCQAWKEAGEWKLWTRFICAFYCEPALKWDYDFGPSNVINGKTRYLDGMVNQWASDPEAPLPQWLELKWDAPQSVREVQLVFDTNLDREFYQEDYVYECVRDYKVQAFVNSGWVTVAAVKDNYQRRRVHRFDPVKTDRLRVQVTRTGGDPAARIFEVRAY